MSASDADVTDEVNADYQSHNAAKTNRMLGSA